MSEQALHELIAKWRPVAEKADKEAYDDKGQCIDEWKAGYAKALFAAIVELEAALAASEPQQEEGRDGR